MKKLFLLFIGLLFWTGSSFGQKLSESFENESPVPPLGWTVYYASPDPNESNLVKHDIDGLDNSRSFRFSSSSFTLHDLYDQYLVTPELIVTEENREISFFYKKDPYSFGNETFRVGWSSTGNAIADFVHWSYEIHDATRYWQQYKKVDLPIGTKYVVVHYMSKYKTSLYIDEVEGPALYVAEGPPNCAVITSPANAVSNMPIETILRWSSGGGAPTGYKLFFGTDGGGISTPVNIENGTNQPSAYLPVGWLDYNTTYYWQVVPSNDFGDAADCPIWSFTTAIEPTISTFPHIENFDGLWVGNPPAPELWKVVNANNDSYTWRQSPISYSSICHSGDYAAHGFGNTDDYLISPLLDLTGVYAKIKWWDRLENEYYSNYYKVLISTTTADISSFTIDLGTFQCFNTSWQEHEIDLAAYKNETIYIAFYQYKTSDQFKYFLIDDVTITKAPDNAEFNISPETINLGTTYIGVTSTQTFTISNTGAGPLEITSVALDESGSDEFHLTHSKLYPYELGYGESLTFDINFTPTNVEPQEVILVISYNPYGLTRTMTYTGTGTPLPPVGHVCENPLPLTFPAFEIKGNTEDYGNDYSEDDVFFPYDEAGIQANYMNGCDVVYEFTVTEEGSRLGGTIATKATHIGAFIFKKPIYPNPITTPTPLLYHVEQDFQFAIFEYEPIGVGTYYLVITSWIQPPAIIELYSNDYNLNLNLYKNVPPDASFFDVDGFWSDIENWSIPGSPGREETNALPGFKTSVTIDGNITVDGQYACGNLTIGPLGKITFQDEDSKLIIQNRMFIESDANGTGSFIANDDNYTALNYPEDIYEERIDEGIVFIERYLTGGWEGNNTGWHQISSPVMDQGIDTFHDYDWEHDFYAWGESENLWLNYFDEGWTGGDNFNLGQGYLISYQDAENWKKFTGKLNNNSVTKTNLTKSAGSYSGWHLLGNPFASALKWNDGNWALNNVASNAKIWHESNQSYSDIAPDGIIPSAQGFMVQVSVDKDNSLIIPAASRVHDATNFFYVAFLIFRVLFFHFFFDPFVKH